MPRFIGELLAGMVRKLKKGVELEPRETGTFHFDLR